jgi:hypothetical protein
MSRSTWTSLEKFPSPSIGVSKGHLLAQLVFHAGLHSSRSAVAAVLLGQQAPVLVDHLDRVGESPGTDPATRLTTAAT